MTKLPLPANVLRGSHGQSPSQFGSPSWSHKGATNRRSDLSYDKWRLWALTKKDFDSIDAEQH